MANNYFARLHKVTKSWTATVLAIRINDRIKYTKVVRNGKPFVVYTASEWMDDMDTTAKEHRNAMECLREHGLIETERHIWNDRNTLHIRLTPFGQSLVDVVENEDTCPEGQVHEVPYGAASQSASEGQYIKDEEYKYGALNKELSSEQSLASDPPTPQEDSGKDDEMKKPVGSVADVLKASQLHHKPDHSLKMGDLWIQLVNETTGKYVPPLTGKQRGQLNDFASKCPSKNGSPVLRYVVERWIEFVKRVEIDAGVKSTPALPNIDFLLKHVGVGVNFAASPKTVPEKQQEVVSHGTSVPDVQLTASPKVQPHKPATKAEILAILNEPDEDEDQGN